MSNGSNVNSLESRVGALLVEFRDRILAEFRKTSVDEIAGITVMPMGIVQAKPAEKASAKPGPRKARARAPLGSVKASGEALVPEILKLLGGAPKGLHTADIRTALADPTVPPKVLALALLNAREKHGVKTKGKAKGMVYLLGGGGGKQVAPKKGGKRKSKVVKNKAENALKRRAAKKGGGKASKMKAKAAKTKANGTKATPSTTATAPSPANDQVSPETTEASTPKTMTQAIQKAYAEHIVNRLKSLPSPKEQAKRYLDTFGVKMVKDIPMARFKEALEKLDALEKEFGVENVHKFEETPAPNGAST